jgi:hypothetical protein
LAQRARSVAADVDVGAAVEQELGDIEAPVRGGDLERRQAGAVEALVDILAFVELGGDGRRRLRA